MAANEVPVFEDYELENRAEVLVKEAQEHRDQAEQHKVVADNLAREAAVLRAKAKRLRERLGEKPPPLPFDVNDRLMGAAALATEDLGLSWQVEELAGLLALRDQKRALRLVLALEHKGLVVRQGEHGYWRTVDPEEKRVRDGAIVLGTFTELELAEHLQMHARTLRHYLEQLRAAKAIGDGEEEGELCYLKPDSYPVERPRRRPPEKDPPAGTEVLSPRGEPVRIVDHGKRANTTNRHRELQRDRRHGAMQSARQARSARDKAKSAANGGGKSKGRRKK